MKLNNEQIKLRKEWRDALRGKEMIREDLEWYRDRSSFAKGDSHHTAFLEGQRMMAVVILDMLKEKKDV